MEFNLTQIILAIVALLAAVSFSIKKFINYKSKNIIQKNIKTKGDVAGGNIDKSNKFINK